MNMILKFLASFILSTQAIVFLFFGGLDMESKALVFGAMYGAYYTFRSAEVDLKEKIKNAKRRMLQDENGC